MLKAGVANKRAKGQTLIGCHLDETFLAEIDKARGPKNRSEFLREVIYDHLKSRGFVIPESVQFAPDRSGKGGPKKKSVSKPASGKSKGLKSLPAAKNHPGKVDRNAG